MHASPSLWSAVSAVFLVLAAGVVQAQPAASTPSTGPLCDAHLHYRRVKQNDLLLGYHGTWHQKVADRYLATT